MFIAGLIVGLFVGAVVGYLCAVLELTLKNRR